MTSTLDTIPIIDVDTHVVEPPDLWTSRVASKWGDRRPHVKWDEQAQLEMWFVGDRPINGVGTPAMAGWTEYPPLHPRTWSDINPVLWDAEKRLTLMDEYGVQSQVLYPNLLLFNGRDFVDADERSLQLECLKAYNDFLTDWSAPRRID